MKKVLVLVLSLAFAGSAAVAQEKQTLTPAAQAPAEQTAGAQISFEETRFDFGTVTEGEKVEHVFKFKNTGTEPLILSNVQTTCGCTVPEWPKEPIMPGKSGSIKATFNTTGKPGQQNKSITIISNSKEGNNIVYVAGMVKAKTADAPATGQATPAAKPHNHGSHPHSH